MDAASKILASLETPEGKAKIDKLIKEYIEAEKVIYEEIKSMMSNTDYVEWLKEFSKDKNQFCSDDWLYYKDEIGEIDRDNVGKLCLFYRGIANYSNQNYIYPIPSKFGNYYRVKLDDFGFEIGMLIGQGTIFSFNKVSIDDDKEFIDFKDIMTNKKQDNVDQINETLDSISNMVITAYESGVPIDVIVSKFYNTINEIEKKEDKPKSMVKK